ncbi:MAG: GNAT family N-acetyltransferase [Acidobacteria bacterium]|nr:GNAT family N-acetyltransferase [Acidobacteriota bacterium]
MKDLRIVRTNSENTDFRDLVVLLDKELSIRDGDDYSFYAQFNKLDEINHVVVIYSRDLAIGCGGIKRFDDKTVEIKRMYVRKEFRGHGVAIKILDELESWAFEVGFETAVLETGYNQPEAIRLYQKTNYRMIENYGQYADVENSICMKKQLK